MTIKKKAMLRDNLTHSVIHMYVKKVDRELNNESCYRDLQPVMR